MLEFYLPKPKDDKIFENLVTDLYGRLKGTTNFQIFGKKGQKQYGVDAVGIVPNLIFGLQCKNHSDSNGKITEAEIAEEIKKSETFEPILDEYHIVTSADNDAKIIKYVSKITKARLKTKKYPIYLKCWDDICRQLLDYPDLLYKYFSRYFPVDKAVDLISFKTTTKQTTKKFPLEPSDIEALIVSNLQDVKQESPYLFSIGVSSFADKNFDKKADVDIYLPDTDPNGFNSALATLKSVKQLLNSPKVSTDLTIFLNTRLSFAFLVGSIFRKVSGYNLTLISGEQVWKSADLQIVPSKITEKLPSLVDIDSKEVVVILNIARDIDPSVMKFIEDTKLSCSFVLSYAVEGKNITSAAHALAVAKDISDKLKSISDSWGVTKIHFFSSMPAGLATLIGWHINASCPIELYYMNEPRSTYIFSGELTNSL